MIKNAHIPIIVLISLAFLPGCVKESAIPLEDTGLQTIPHYRAGSSEFDTHAAIGRMKAAEEAEKKRKETFDIEVKKRIETAAGGVKLDIPDPWIPPLLRVVADLPVALRMLPTDKFGYTDWVKAQENGLIKPRGSIASAPEEEKVFDANILFDINDLLMANVVFSHRVHTALLSCKNCHPSIFREKKGGNKFSMNDVWNGEYCGKCHGKVAFQPKGFDNCQRCHSSSKR